MVRGRQINHTWYVLILILLMLAGVVAASVSTRLGAALSDDSVAYIKPARNMLSGKAPNFTPHYPPLIPLLLTGFGFLGVEPLAGIRILNIACFALNIFLFSLIVRNTTGSNGFALLGGGLALFQEFQDCAVYQAAP